jgi:HAE1 family hydrophobic/amphiphilic exporter-1
VDSTRYGKLEHIEGKKTFGRIYSQDSKSYNTFTKLVLDIFLGGLIITSKLLLWYWFYCSDLFRLLLRFRGGGILSSMGWRCSSNQCQKTSQNKTDFMTQKAENILKTKNLCSQSVQQWDKLLKGCYTQATATQSRDWVK